MYRTCVTFDSLSNVCDFVRRVKELQIQAEAIIDGDDLQIIVYDNDATSNAVEALADKWEGKLGCWDIEKKQLAS